MSYPVVLVVASVRDAVVFSIHLVVRDGALALSTSISLFSLLFRVETATFSDRVFRANDSFYSAYLSHPDASI